MKLAPRPLKVDDRKEKDFDVSGGMIYRCIEHLCTAFDIHSHTRRPYLIYRKVK